jgi:hypothetical protein
VGIRPLRPQPGHADHAERGELINRQSGLCLDVANSNTGDGAAIDQWTCNGGANQQWMAIPVNGNYYLMPILDLAQLTEIGAATPSLGIGNGSTCETNGDGDSAYTRTTGTTGNPCDEWDIQQASYDFATYPVGVPKTNEESDGRGYQCVQGDNLRTNGGYSEAGAGNYVYRVNYWDFRNMSHSSVSAQETTPDEPPFPNHVPNGTIGYTQSVSTSDLTGQVMLYCDPSTTTP